MNIEAECDACAFLRFHWKDVLDDAYDQLHLEVFDVLERGLVLVHANKHANLPIQEYYDFLRTR